MIETSADADREFDSVDAPHKADARGSGAGETDLCTCRSENVTLKTHTQRIIVVEDDRNIAKSLAIRLSALGYEVKTLHDGATGTMAAINLLPDLLIVDISMPAGSGFNLVESVRQHKAAQSIPVIFMTAFKNDRLRDRAEELGCVGFLEKPYSPDDLTALVSEALAMTSDSTDNREC